MSPDDRLARRAARGDQRAFAEIYRRYNQDLYRFCLAMVGNPQDAQDSLQNTMVKVLRSLPGEERSIQLKPWLYRIARNESVETLRKRRDNAELEPHQAAVLGVSDAAESRERLRTLLADLEQLPERQRAALVMRELSGLDFEQIGATFGTSAAVARQTLYEARLSLRQLEAGREMRCNEVMRELSDADGRVTRRREIRAHLDNCPDCRAFRDEIGRRHEDLAGLAPLPLTVSAGLLQGLLGEAAASGGTVVGGGGLAGAVGLGTGKAIATSAIVKSAATVAVVAVVGVSAADRGGLIDVPLPGKSGSTSGQGAAEPQSASGEVDPTAGSDAALQGATPKQPPGGGAGAGEQGKEGGYGVDGPSQQTRGDAAPGKGSSNSQVGLSPPGGGNGRSASEGHGQPEGLPEAAGHGQQTAAANKSANAASPPGQSATGGSQGKAPSGQAPAAAKPSSPPKAKAPAATDSPQSSVEPSSQAKNDLTPPGQGGTPPGHER